MFALSHLVGDGLVPDLKDWRKGECAVEAVEAVVWLVWNLDNHASTDCTREGNRRGWSGEWSGEW